MLRRGVQIVSNVHLLKTKKNTVQKKIQYKKRNTKTKKKCKLQNTNLKIQNAMKNSKTE